MTVVGPDVALSGYAKLQHLTARVLTLWFYWLTLWAPFGVTKKNFPNSSQDSSTSQRTLVPLTTRRRHACTQILRAVPHPARAAPDHRDAHQHRLPHQHHGVHRRAQCCHVGGRLVGLQPRVPGARPGQRGASTSAAAGRAAGAVHRGALLPAAVGHQVGGSQDHMLAQAFVCPGCTTTAAFALSPPQQGMPCAKLPCLGMRPRVLPLWLGPA